MHAINELGVANTNVECVDIQQMSLNLPAKYNVRLVCVINKLRAQYVTLACKNGR